MPLREARLVRVARALGDPARLRILRALSAREISCQELTRLFALAQATISHHLKVLSDAGLVTVRKGGAFHFYRAEPAALAAHAAALAALAGALLGPGCSRSGRAAAAAPSVPVQVGQVVRRTLPLRQF
ncbi:MAG TPA: metalloregulator ArsR/SmtB family transcription factor, partial [Anaeromyxobacter sp.]|nr:metalloregulator ArsR/SmtB family transcription factor [Anaeromyxobacter sp.]